MKVVLENIGKKFNHEWIFKNVTLNFSINNCYGICGANGSGKSTLLKLISGSIDPSDGEIMWFSENGERLKENSYKHLSLATPYQELIEEFTLIEMLEFHSKLKPFIKNLSVEKIISAMELKKHSYKTLKNFSSGMKQRVKLAMCLLSDTSLLLIDEPFTNLDEDSKKWYSDLLNSVKENKTIIICSNYQKEEIGICNHIINITDYK